MNLILEKAAETLTYMANQRNPSSVPPTTLSPSEQQVKDVWGDLAYEVTQLTSGIVWVWIRFFDDEDAPTEDWNNYEPPHK